MKTVRRVPGRRHPRVFDIGARAVRILYQPDQDGIRNLGTTNKAPMGFVVLLIKEEA